MKKRYLILLALLIIIIQIIFVVYSYKQDNDITLSNDYIAVFKSETGERVYSTYIYLKTKKKKKTYKYINTISTSNGYDSINWNEEIIKKGTLKKKKKAFDIAKKHGSYSYVKYKDGKIYSIEEFKKVFK
ncbi:MAG: hypothetical protein VZS44_06450 [Bacilli bacterium]|nr:hypothetical protein [Bacilli bacterium]